MSNKTLSTFITEKITVVNETLDSFGEVAFQDMNIGPKKFRGYKPQFVIDAMNKAFGSGGWKHEVVATEIQKLPKRDGGESTSILALVKVLIIGDDGTTLFETGVQAGGADVIGTGLGNAVKSAITDGIGKALSLLSVGNKAYRGELLQGYEDASAPSANTGGFSSFGGGASATQETAPATDGGSSENRFSKPSGGFGGAPKSTGGFGTKTETPETTPQEATPEAAARPAPTNGGGSFGGFGSNGNGGGSAQATTQEAAPTPATPPNGGVSFGKGGFGKPFGGSN